ncbi:MAG: transcriptional repressor [Proteobacteria bacterium]|nr:transcriptional repressor [Desulfobulbaceae bacterium]MBU4152195.1 transcriptional repressor [Pseudomonadota bacterium]
MIKQPLHQFEEFLSKQNLRLTGQRQLIVNAFLKHKGHISSEELYRKVQKTSPDIGFTTVYRTLKLLSEAGLATSKNFGNGYARFESTNQQEHHDHLICTKCGKIVEFVNDQIETLQNGIAQRHGFMVTDHTLDIYGICQDCK